LAGFGFLGWFILAKQPCRNKFGLPLYTGKAPGNWERSNGSMNMVVSQYCYLGEDDLPDPVFPGETKRITVGFFNSLGILQTYPARLGGSDFIGQKLNVGFCAGDSNAGQCSSFTPEEAVSRLIPDQIYTGLIVVRDNAMWKGRDQTTKHQAFFDKFIQALKNGRTPPKPPADQDFVLQIVQFEDFK